jgi:anti-sigma regulatory factor (Ser/Thr protein kinase)
VRLRLPKDRKAPLLARAFVRNALCERHSRETRDEVELLVSELVTNAVLHGGSLVTLEVECESPDGISASVSDSSPTWPVARRPDLLDEGGRGLELVELISDAWGVREAGVPPTPTAPEDGAGTPARPSNPLLGLLPRQAQGKAVWFHLAG